MLPNASIWRIGTCPMAENPVLHSAHEKANEQLNAKHVRSESAPLARLRPAELKPTSRKETTYAWHRHQKSVHRTPRQRLEPRAHRRPPQCLPAHLVEWNRQSQTEIRALHAVELEALQEKILASHEQELTRLTQHLQRLEEEMAKRELQFVETKDLFRLSSLVRAEIRKVRLEPDLGQASLAAVAAPAGK